MKRISLLSGVTLLALTACQDEKPTLMAGSFANLPSPLQGLNAKRRMDPQVLHALSLLEAENFKEASTFINQALQTQPRSTALHILNGLTYEKMAEAGGDSSQIDLALVGYQNAINVDPNNLFALSKLGTLKYKNKQFDQAQEHFANALLIKPNDVTLLQELAASSYYAYDLKTALKAIQKAEKIAPEDALIQRSSAMIYAALGDFQSADKKFQNFEKAVGEDPEVSHVAARIADWKSLHASGRIYMAQSPSGFSPFSQASDSDSDSSDPYAPGPSVASESQQALGIPLGSANKPKSSDSDDSSDTSDDSSNSDSSAPPSPEGNNTKTPGKTPAGFPQDKAVPSAGGEIPLPNALSEDPSESQQVIVDAYMLRIVEDVHTSKGNNILENFSVTLSPGGFDYIKGKATGSALTSKADAAAAGTTGDTLSHTPGAGSNGQILTNNNGFGPNFTPSANTVSINNAGGFSSHVFSSGLSWAGLTYNLNIANAADHRTEVTARPSLSTFLNQQSVFFSGVELVQGFTGTLSGGTIQSYPVGVTLVVKPVSINDDEVSLEIALEGSLLNEADPDLSSTVNVLKTRVDTKVKMKLGETLMLGGIYERAEEMSKSGFPGLRDTPIVQYMFSNEQTISARGSVVFMLTPRSTDAVALAVRKAMHKEINPALSELAHRNPDWLKTEPNLVKIFSFLATDPIIYQEFRNGDILPPSWGWEPSITDQLGQLTSFLYY